MTAKWFGRAAAIFFLSGISLASVAHDHELSLRIEDAVAAPGGQAVISLRTYSTRPVGQGTICLRFDAATGQNPTLGALKGVKVFAQAEDAIHSFSASEQNGALIVDIEFSSSSASINSIDGPVAALYFDVAPTALPGSEIDVDIEPAQTTIFDATGAPIPIELRGGKLVIRHPDAPVQIAAEAHLPDTPGLPVTLSMQTNEPFRIASGQVGIRYSSRELTGAHVLRDDPRFGSVDVKMDGHAGLAIFNLVHAEPSFNELPGNILSIDIMPNPAFDPGNEPVIELDPAFTHLYDQDGNWILVDIEASEYALPDAPAPNNQRRSK